MARPRKTDGPLAGEIAALKAIGMDDAEIKATIMARNNPLIMVGDAGPSAVPGQHPPAPAQTADRVQDRQRLGPDAEMLERLERFRASYTPPPGPETFHVPLEKRWADYLRQKAMILSARRNEDITPERAMELVLRDHWRLDQDRLLMTAGRTGPRSAFNPATGTYGQ